MTYFAHLIATKKIRFIFLLMPLFLFNACKKEEIKSLSEVHPNLSGKILFDGSFNIEGTLRITDPYGRETIKFRPDSMEYSGNFTADGGVIFVTESPSGGTSIVISDDFEGSNQTVILSNFYSIRNPVFLDETETTVFYGKLQDENSWLYSLEAGTDTPKKIPNTENAHSAFTVSPDGKKLAFTVREERGLFSVNTDGTNLEFLMDTDTSSRGHTLVIYPDWSPDGEKILFYKQRTIMILDLNTKEQTTLRDGWNPRWSPDGEKIAYLEHEEGKGLVSLSSYYINIMDKDGSNAVAVPRGNSERFYTALNGIYDWK